MIMVNQIKTAVTNPVGKFWIQQQWLVISIVLVLLTACGEGAIPSGSSGTQAYWNAETGTLEVSGTSTQTAGTVDVHDASDGTLLGSAIVKDDGSWAASSSASACDIHITLPTGTETVRVENAPADCGTSNDISGRVVADNDIPAGVKVVSNPQPLSTVPNAVILNPPQDVTINAGEWVTFSGTAVGTAVTPPISYYWNFGGAAPNSTVQNPGAIRFDVPGTYFVQLSVADNLGIPDPTPAVRTIVVNNFNSPIGTTPTPVITSPIAINGTVSVNIGESLFFSGSATDSTGSSFFTYEWNFSGIYPNQFGQTPGSIPFTRAGTYIVTLYATNQLGIRSVIPATLTVNVGFTTGINQPPIGSITRPRNDVTINAGESLNFRATATDPDNDLPLYYSWDFNGVAPNIYMSTNGNAGNITFNTPGIFYIRMTTTDSEGASDPNPPVRIVTVRSTSSFPPPGNGVLFTDIVSPPTDVTIQPGQSVYFSGQTSSGNQTGLVYFWNFDGAAVNSNLLTPGSITFAIPGQYLVQFVVTDFAGNLQGTPVTRVITVQDPSTAQVNILSPINNTVINLGSPVTLTGSIGNSIGLGSLTYRWTIKDNATNRQVFNSSVLSPGQYIFTSAGDYTVRLRVQGIDAFGNRVSSTAKSRVTVINIGSFPPGTFPPGTFPPNTTPPGTFPPGTFPPGTFPPGPIVTSNGILSPAADMYITIGNSVNFSANPISGNVTYQWDFGGAAPASFLATPGPVRFNSEGSYLVTLKITGTGFTGLPINQFDQRVVTVVRNIGSIPPGTIPPGVIPPGSFPPGSIPPGTFPPVTAPPVINGTEPNGVINRPAANTTIRVGQSVYFSGTGFDPLGTGPLTYLWSFGGAAPNIVSQSPGSVSFNQVGKFVVTLLVQNSYGQFDPEPDTVVITVTP